MSIEEISMREVKTLKVDRQESNMKINYLLIICMFLVIISCQENIASEKYKFKKIENGNETVNNINTEIAPVPKKDTTIISILNKLNFDILNRKYGNGATSSFISKKYSNIYYNQDTTGFYGLYYFINDDADVKLGYLSTVVVYAKKKPWKITDKEQKIIEITSLSSKIKLSTNISVGMSKQNVIDKFGTPLVERNNYIFYKDDSNAVLSVRIINDTVVAFKIGVYKEQNIEQLIDNIIKYSSYQFRTIKHPH